ncbi:MAG: RHS repeat-associated core domain-containing protein, partial [Candidatus Limnocylindrales bacterium]
TYAYDRLYRLTAVTGPDGARSYAYDPVGNRTSKVLAGTPTTSTYDRADRITAAGALAISVNANGNTTAKGPDTFTYDQPNRLKTATVGGATETYVYDGDGVRFSRQVGGGTPIRYVSDINRSLPVTIDDGSRKYVYGLGLAYAVSGSTIEVYHPDRLGSTRAITDAAGGVTATYRTDEWGIPTASTGSSTQPFRFTGEPQDATGLMHLRSRYYDPAIGRFMSRDVLAGYTATPGSLNRFAYVASNPTSYTDPSGACPITAVWVVLLGGLGTFVGPEGTIGGAAAGQLIGVALCGLELNAEVSATKALLDLKKGDLIPPKSSWRGTPLTGELAPPGPMPEPGPDPNLDPHQNPPGPVGPGLKRALIAALTAVLGARLLAGLDQFGDRADVPERQPIRPEKPRALREPVPVRDS